MAWLDNGTRHVGRISGGPQRPPDPCRSERSEHPQGTTMSRHVTPRVVVRSIAIAAALVSLAACGRRHYLAQYQFADRTLGMVYIEPPAPELLHGYYDLRVPENPMQAVVYAGGGVAKEVEPRRARARLDSAGQTLDVAGRVAQRTAERGSPYLGTPPVMKP